MQCLWCSGLVITPGSGILVAVALTTLPGHGIPIRVFMELVAQCAICQKYRLGLMDNLAPVIRHLMPLHHRGTIGFDTMEVSARAG